MQLFAMPRQELQCHIVCGRVGPRTPCPAPSRTPLEPIDPEGRLAVRDLSIPAIPTLYDGVLYRSRTEARWAKFWKQLGIACQYEPQGFIAAGIPYLPDFAVYPALGVLWVEIKPTWQADPGGVTKWQRFADRRPSPEKSRAALFAGPP